MRAGGFDTLVLPADKMDGASLHELIQGEGVNIVTVESQSA